jgi:ParB/RepB/Spo0J family partition protein
VELKVVSIKEIVVGDRFRKDLGDLDSLVESFKKEGIIQPLAVKVLEDGTYYLLAGGRRIVAATRAGVADIPVRIYPATLSTIEMRSIELMENFARKDLSWVEMTNLKKEIHDLQVQIYGAKMSTAADATGVSKRDTAKMLGVSSGGLMDDIKLAEAMALFPDLGKMKTKADAVKTFKKMQETLLTQEVARRIQSRQSTTPAGILQSNLCDCFIINDFFKGIKQVPDNSIDIVEIDPPYGIDLHHIKKESTGSGSSTMDYNEIPGVDYIPFLARLFHECYRVMSENSWLICWFAIEPWFEVVYQSLSKAGFRGSRLASLWVKESTTGQSMQPTTYLASIYEPFFYMRKGSPIITRQGRTNVFQYKVVPSQKKIHPTERPIELMQDVLQTFGWEGCRVLVPFLGSGNTLLAASNLGMTAFGFELSEAYKNSFVLRVSESVPTKYRSYREEQVQQ